MTEHQEQVAVITWFRLQHRQYANYLFAIPNGGVRNIGTAVKLKKEGVLAGVPDLFLMMPMNGYHGLWIEIKAINGRVSNSQKQFMGAATLMGYHAVVCYGFNDAKNAINNYLQNKFK
jgi:hypothetical protein